MRRRKLGGLGVAGAIAATVLSVAAPLPSSRAAASSVTRYAPATAGLAPLFARDGAAASPSASSAAASRPHGVRRTHRPSPGAAAGIAPTAAAAAAASTVPSRILQSFNGVSSLDSAQANFGAQFEPPDPGLCVGNGYVLEPVNSAYRVFRTNGNTVIGPFNVNDLFNEGAKEFTSDPRCYYDASTNTWFATILYINSASTASRIDVAVNTTGDPTRAWNEYRIDTTNGTAPRGAGCPCFGDQPTLGIDHHNLYITTNEFSILGPQYNGAQIYAIAKSDLVAGRTAHVAHFGPLSIGGALAASIQPALTTGTPSAEYFLNSLDPNATFDSRIGVWALTDAEGVASGRSPILTSTVLSSEAYGVPPRATQKGAGATIDAGDDRMQQAQFVTSSYTLWGALTTAVTIPGDPAERAGVAWFAVRPTLDGDAIGRTVIVHQGYVADRGNSLIYPAIQADQSGHAAMVFTRTGPTIHPSAAYAVLGAGQSQFGPPITAAAGSAVYDPTATRWGDYSFAVIDPSGKAFWFATEYVPPASSQTANRLRNWGSRVLEVCVC